ncbi:MAG TPA: radical SAM protein, partial [Bacillota bacterium]|nr:radical SAM protein [Bacillota bacterium]
MFSEIAKPESFDHLIKKHPCFNGEAHFKYGRLHLPVSPDCNIQCGFCKRGFNKYEDRPGVSRMLLKPDQAVKLVAKALESCPELTVVGIAGPGDTLATDHALEVFEMVHQNFPQLMNCLSTNGLLLEEKAERVAAAGVKTVTVTVNAVDPAVLKHICSYIRYHDQYLTGEYAARLLISSQLAGIRRMVALGGIMKINTVLIPG